MTNNATFPPSVGPSKYGHFWFWVWFGLGFLMVVLSILSKASFGTLWVFLIALGLCLVAWFGGIAATLMVQEREKRRVIAKHPEQDSNPERSDA